MNIYFYNLLKNLQSFITKKKLKLIISINYHRVGNFNLNDPFHMLHTVSSKVFTNQIDLFKKIGYFVSPDQVRHYDGLKPINFLLTFDDVSSTILDLEPYLRSKRIPYVIAPCTDITNRGFGLRDKVYNIIKFLDQEIIYNHCKSNFNEFNIDKSDFSFYSFSKNDSIHPYTMRDKIIEPLFKKISRSTKVDFDYRAYLSWEDIRTHFLKNKLVTIANHSSEHLNMTRLSKEEIDKDVELSQKLFSEQLSIEPKYYAVPFGHVKKNILYNLNYTLRTYRYHGIFWVTNGYNYCGAKSKHQLIHLRRITAPTSLSNTIKSLFLALFRASGKIINDCIVEKEHSLNNHIVKASNNPEKSNAIENIFRQGKDYSSDLKYYNYCFNTNPYKHSKDDYIYSEVDKRIESIGYNFHCDFLVSKQIINGAYWGSWRKFPFSNHIANGFVFMKAMRQNQILGSYKPSEQITTVFNSNKWNKIKVYNILLKSPKINIAKNNKITISTHIECPSMIEKICEKYNNYFFTINRSKKFFQWRIDNYFYQTAKYIMALDKDKQPLGYFIINMKKNNNKIEIIDFLYNHINTFQILLEHIILENEGIEKIELETSIPDLFYWINNNHKIKFEIFYNYYFLSNKVQKLFEAKNNKKMIWNEELLHETKISGDTIHI